MKKYQLLTFLLASITLVGCSNGGNSTSTSSASTSQESKASNILNGGFETTDLSGWTIEYGTAYNDDSVSSKTSFTYDYDNEHNEIPLKKEGNWFLSGKGFDDSYSHGRIGAIRSTNFVLGGSGIISLKLAGGALTKSKGAGAAYKDDNSICYVGIYLAKNDELIHRQTNAYFIEHTESYVDVTKYEKGVYNTDNFVDYSVDLYDYLGEEMYIRIVDNDKDVYYGYLSVDDIRIGDNLPQEEGQYFVKTHNYIEDVEAPSEYDIKNGGFETGSLAGWEVLEGQAFSHEGVNDNETWWNENISYQRDGNFHYGHYYPSATGRMRSSTFILGGSGYISFKLGGCANQDLTYLSFFVKGEDKDIEVARYSNRKYWNFQFPYVPNGMRLLNMVQYVANLSEYLGKTMYIEVVDNNSSTDELGCITLDSIVTYNVNKPNFYTNDHYDAISSISVEIESPSIYQVLNGTFETGDLTGWESSGDIGVITDNYSWWNAYPYNKKGTYLFSGETCEGNMGYLKSSSFIVGGIAKMSFLLGGAKNPNLCYISLMENDSDIELARFRNHYYHDLGVDANSGLLRNINKGSNLLNMVQYVADLSEFKNKEVYLKVVDNSSGDWGLLAVDSFITYYEDENALPANYYEAKNILAEAEVINEYQVLNGGFETGDLTGWTISNTAIGGISASEFWWDEWYSYDKDGLYHFDGWLGSESETGTLTSSAFVVGGINKISFKLGGAKNADLCFIEIIDATSEEVYFTFHNYKFNDAMVYKYYYSGQPISLGDDNVYMANMATYIADLNAIGGKEVKIRITDNASNDWGLIFADSFVTYYESEDLLPNGFQAQ